MSAVPPPAREPCPGCSRISTRHRRLSGRPHLARRRSDVPKSPPLNPGRRLTPPGRASPRVTRSAQPPPPSESSRRGAPKWLLAPGRREGSRGGRSTPARPPLPPASLAEVLGAGISSGSDTGPSLCRLQGQPHPWGGEIAALAAASRLRDSTFRPAQPGASCPAALPRGGAGERGCRWAVPHL